MNTLRIIGIILIVCGVFGLMYGGFSYTKETHVADLGVMQVSVDERDSVSIPLWLGAALVAAGVLLLVNRKSIS